MKRLHREDGAQISFLAVAGVLCFVGLMSMVVNTENLLSERVRVQNVADATVLSAASWTARGLNMESYINVLNSKLISTAILLNALNDALPVIEAVGKIQEAIFQGCSGVPFVGAFCIAMAAVVKVQLAVLTPLKNAVKNLAERLSNCGTGGKLWTIMTSLEKVGDAVRLTFPAIGIIESIDIASANGTTGIVLNGKFTPQAQLTLPVNAGQFPQFCEPVKNGGLGYQLQGYEAGEGPLEVGQNRIKKTLLIPFITMFSWPIFSGMVSAHIVQAGCTPNPGEDTSIPVKLTTLEECRKYEVTSRWSHLWSQTRPLTDGSLRLEDFVPWRPRNNANDSGGDDEVNKSEIEKQLGNINIPRDPEAPASGPAPVQMGRAYEFLEPSTERRIALAEVSCDGSGYPFYTPVGGNWEISVPGTTFCFGFQNCPRIDSSGKFVWYNAPRHVRNGSPKNIGGYFIRMTREEEDPESEGGPKRYVYSIETVSLIDAGTKKMSQEEFKKYLEENSKDEDKVNSDPSNSSSGCTKPKPWMLTKDQDFEARLKFIGVVYENVSDRPLFWSNYFQESPPRLIAYAQAQVYNYLSEDTFTQDWRVRLQPASLLSDFLKRPEAQAAGLSRLAGDAIDAVNNH
jgi:hypothetical protein